MAKKYDYITSGTKAQMRKEARKMRAKGIRYRILHSYGSIYGLYRFLGK